MFRQEFLLTLQPLFEAHLERSGYVLADLRFFRRQDGIFVLEALVDRREGGITLEECSRLSRELGAIADEAGGPSARYTLDVSSPGMDRPLATAADFRRVAGRAVRVFLREPVSGRIEWEGAVEAVEDGGLRLIVKDTTKIDIPWDKINKGKQVIS